MKNALIHIVEILSGSVSSLPMDDNIFDLVTAFETYYFCPDLINDLKEIKRTLKPGGILLMVNETYKHKNFEERNDKIIDILDITIHTPGDYKIFLKKSGFSNIKINELVDKNWLTAIGQK
jgi:SAM-dependent methyltransferase